jgi:transposase
VQVKKTSASPRGWPVGRPTKLTPEVQRAICESIALSIPNKYAADEAGIDEDTFASWMRRGREGRAPYAAFYRAVTRARASAVKSLTVRVLGGGKGSAGATWLLERRFREDYGPSQKLELSGDPEKPLTDPRAGLAGLTTAEIRAALKKLGT